MDVLASVMAATLAVGTQLVDTLGAKLDFELASAWKPDPAFWDLVRGRDVIDGLPRELCDPRFVSNYATLSGTQNKAKCVEWMERRKLDHWRPRWLMFPQTKYTPRPLTARKRRKALHARPAGLSREARTCWLSATAGIASSCRHSGQGRTKTDWANRVVRRSSEPSLHFGRSSVG